MNLTTLTGSIVLFISVNNVIIQHIVVLLSVSSLPNCQIFFFVLIFAIIRNNTGSKLKLLNHVQLFATPWTEACQAPHPWDFPGKNTGVGCRFLLHGRSVNQPHKQIFLYIHNCIFREIPGSDIAGGNDINIFKCFNAY